MPGAPERRDYDSVIKDLQDRIDKLERSARRPQIFLPNSTAPIGTPTGGGLFWVEAGALHYKGTGGTNTTVAPA